MNGKTQAEHNECAHSPDRRHEKQTSISVARANDRRWDIDGKGEVEQGPTSPKAPVGTRTHGLRVSENSLSAVFGARVCDGVAFIKGSDEAILDQFWNFDRSHADIVRCHDLLHLLQRRARGIRLGL